MKPKISRLFHFTPVCAVTLISIAAVGTLHAQTWSGGGDEDLWGTGANWGGIAPVPGSATDISFAGATRLTPDDNLTFMVVPEPRAALLGRLGIIALLRRRRH